MTAPRPEQLTYLSVLIKRVKANPQYRTDYERGWRASRNYPDSIENNGGPSILERADDRGEPGAWYDGYGDWACGNPKWHSAEDRLL